MLVVLVAVLSHGCATSYEQARDSTQTHLRNSTDELIATFRVVHANLPDMKTSGEVVTSLKHLTYRLGLFREAFILAAVRDPRVRVKDPNLPKDLAAKFASNESMIFAGERGLVKLARDFSSNPEVVAALRNYQLAWQSFYSQVQLLAADAKQK